MINHLDAAKGILGRDYVDAEDREFALVHALVAIAERLTVPPGRCGHMAPIMGGTVVGFDRQECCVLPAGHEGWHRSDCGSEWNEPQTSHETSRDEHLGVALQVLAKVRTLVEYAELAGQTVLAVDAVRDALDGE